MRELIIIAEGHTEFEFINKCISPYLNNFGILSVKPILISSSPGHKGGIRKGSYQKLKFDVHRYLKQMKDVLVTTLIDYYRLPPEFPGYTEAVKKTLCTEKALCLEQAMDSDINDKRFIPYIQMHEFEALLFTKLDGFRELPAIDRHQIAEIQKIIDDFENPEMIDDGNETAPSKRLIKIIPGYNKKTYGNSIAITNGFTIILDKCPRFRNWIEKLMKQMTFDV
jgi:hypothetical protein